MNVLNGIENFLTFVESNWTNIVVIVGLSISIGRKVKDYFSKSNEEKIAIAKAQIHEKILKMISDAEEDYKEWIKAGSIKRSQVIGEIFASYPILSKVIDQESLIGWIDDEINDALDELRKIIEENEVVELQSPE